MLKRGIALVVTVLLICAFSLPANAAYAYREEFRNIGTLGVKTLVTVSDLSVSEDETQSFLESYVHVQLKAVMPPNVKVVRGPEADTADARLWVQVCLGERTGGGYYGSVILTVDRYVQLASVVPGTAPFRSDVYMSYYIINGTDVSGIEDQLEEVVNDLLSEFSGEFAKATS